jgi:hypothetical protein
MDNNIEKAVKPEVSKEMLLEVIKELQEIIIGMVEVEEEEPETESETETEAPELEVEGPAPIGDPEKNAPNWPMSKSSSLWGGVFSLEKNN